MGKSEEHRMEDGMNIFQSIAACMSDIGAIGKNSKNIQQNFMFRGIDAVMNALSPVLTKNKVFIVPNILEQTREERTSARGGTLIYSVCKIKYTFYAEDGSFIEATVIGEGMDSGDKATNKAMSIAYKYACFQVFCIPTEEMADPDGECHEVKPKSTKSSAKSENGSTPVPVPDAPKAEAPAAGATVSEVPARISAVQAKALASRCRNEGVPEKVILDLYKVRSFEELTLIKYTNINEHWEQIIEKSKAV